MDRYQPGEDVLRFRIVEKIGEGGLGQVYLAEDTKLGRRVVVKCILPQDNEEAAAELELRFDREARAQAKVNHPGICAIYDAAPGIIVMEYLDGGNLAQFRASERLTRRRILDLTIDICDAVAAAHKAGLVHRDLTPKNIMITASGVVKILDFGLAKLAGSQRLTQHNQILGTPGYMAPEQMWNPLNVDSRADIFSIGVILYEMITGILPYSMNEFLSQEVPPIPEEFEAAGCDPWPELQGIVTDALAWSPDDRFQNLESMADQLKKVRASLDPSRRSYDFFDTTTLLELVCPAAKTASGRQRHRRARDQFTVSISRSQAVSSSTALAELLDCITRSYFEEDPRLAENPQVRAMIRSAKKELAAARAKGGKLVWETLQGKEKLLFFGKVKGFFEEGVRELTGQLSKVEVNSDAIVEKLIDLSQHAGVDRRDALILSEAWGMPVLHLFSEVRAYHRAPYTRYLKKVGPNCHQFRHRPSAAEVAEADRTPGPHAYYSATTRKENGV
ncbi:MAG: serine/threonine protein kinase [Bryobacterales bacterium]|nr:serine/threonine protein kinase [Bryobacterales bacterium]